MFDRLVGFISSLNSSDQTSDGDGFAPDDSRLCAAALMYHVIQADGVLHDSEQQRFETLVREQNSMDGSDLIALLEAAKQADEASVDLYRFTSVLVRSLEIGQRIDFIELLWELVYSDGERHELEDNIVWRISDLLGVDGRDRVAMRQRVRARTDVAGDPQ